jgi:hypothetical protein
MIRPKWDRIWIIFAVLLALFTALLYWLLRPSPAIVPTPETKLCFAWKDSSLVEVPCPVGAVEPTSAEPENWI